MTTTEAEWLVPFRGRGHSGWYDVNFVARYGDVYVMDNHRAAPWCWRRHLASGEAHAILHVDRHYDCLASRLDDWLAVPPPMDGSLRDYLEHAWTPEDVGYPIPVVNWGNHLSLYLARYGPEVSEIRCISHRCGDPPVHPRFVDLAVDAMDGGIWANWSPDARWVVDIDLDAFFGGTSEDAHRLVHDDAIDRLVAVVRQAREDGRVAATTLCLTPDTFTTGWADAEALAARMLRPLGIEFALEAAP